MYGSWRTLACARSALWAIIKNEDKRVKLCLDSDSLHFGEAETLLGTVGRRSGLFEWDLPKLAGLWPDLDFARLPEQSIPQD